MRTEESKDNGGPDPAEVERITSAIIESLGEMDLESALTVVCNLAGQLVCILAKGKPSLVQRHSDNIAENIKAAALIKMIHDDNERRRAETT